MTSRLLAIVALATLSACGQTGDLYIPDASPVAEPVSAPESPTEDKEDDKETPAG